ncbi:MAG TPA: hypothetical protein VIF15_10345 [Polyangiaceae bacterium]|jgi:hypothetical protein
MKARAAALAAAAVVAVVATVTVRELSIGRDEVTLADAAAAKSDWPEAIGHARAAAEALVPGSPWPERGRQRLDAIGHDAEARGDDDTALLAYGAMRTAALATRAPGSSSDRWKAKAEEGLARVASSRKDVAALHITSESMLDALRAEEPPPTWMLTLLAASAAAMLGGLARLAWVADPRTARVAQLVAGVGLLAYAIVMLVS